MMPILHSPGVMMPGQLGPMSRQSFIFEKIFDPHHIHDGNALGNGHDQFRPASAASMMASAAKGGGTKIMQQLAPYFVLRRPR
jgi:hypothetical protein